MVPNRIGDSPQKSNSPKGGTFSAIVAACVFVVTFLLTNVPGNPVIGPGEIVTNGKYGPHFECGVDSMLHGWPFTHLKHDGFIEATFHRCSAWEIGDHPKFFAGALAANIAVWLISAAIAFWLIRGRIAQHGWRFGLSHLLLVMCSLSIPTSTTGCECTVPRFESLRTTRSRLMLTGNRLGRTGYGASRERDTGTGETSWCLSMFRMLANFASYQVSIRSRS